MLVYYKRLLFSMKVIFIKFFILYSLSSIAEEYIFESSSHMDLDEIIVDKDNVFKNFKVEARWTDSLGEYGKGNCLGFFLEQKKSIAGKAYCEYSDSKKDKFWLALSRTGDEIKSGIGTTTYLKGTGKYKSFIGISCKYAITYLDKNTNFYRHKCKLKN